MLKQSVRTTVTLPEQLLKAVDQAVEAGKAKSRNELIAIALGHELAALRRLEIDQAFEERSADQEYQQESLKLSEEFAESDSETLSRLSNRNETR